ncbi:unnamed protein product, partial [Owenia fusiformis]
GVPAVIVAISLGLDFTDIDPDFKPMYGEGICWISQRYPLLLFFTLPIAITILLNIGFFIPTAIILWKSMNQRTKRLNRPTEYPFAIYAKLFCLLGFTWILAFIAPYNIALWYIFIILNASQGVYIFLAFVLKKQVWDDFNLSAKSNKSQGTTATNLSSKAITSQHNNPTNQTEGPISTDSDNDKKDSVANNMEETNVDSVRINLSRELKIDMSMKENTKTE